MAVRIAPQVPRTASDDGVIDAVRDLLGGSLLEANARVGEVTLTVVREEIVPVLRALRDTPGLEYQQLMEIAGVDYPERVERFEVNYHLLSLTMNRRIRVKLSTDEDAAVPSVVDLWPVASWLEREVFDMYGVTFAGNPDLRRILTDYGFEGHPFRKDFPLTGYTEMRYSEAEKRVIYEPVDLPQDFRTFDFLMPWEGPAYRLPGDEKAEAEAPGAPTSAAAPGGPAKVPSATDARTPKTTDSPADTGAGKPTNEAVRQEARKSADAKAEEEVSKESDIPDPNRTGSGKRRPGGGPA